MSTTTVAFCGYGRAGKDTAGEYLSQISPLRYNGSASWAMLPHMAKLLGKCEQVAWDSRHANRMAWYEACNEFRKHDPSRIVKLCLDRAEIVTGIRDRVELLAAKREGLLTHVVWVDRPGTPVDPTVTYTLEDCDYLLINNGDIEQFKETIRLWALYRGIPLYDKSGPSPSTQSPASRMVES